MDRADKRSARSTRRRSVTLGSTIAEPTDGAADALRRQPALLSALIVVDGQSTWLEGAALVGLYVIIAASVWWGPAITA